MSLHLGHFGTENGFVFGLNCPVDYCFSLFHTLPPVSDQKRLREVDNLVLLGTI